MKPDWSYLNLGMPKSLKPLSIYFQSIIENKVFCLNWKLDTKMSLVKDFIIWVLQCWNLFIIFTLTSVGWELIFNIFPRVFELQEPYWWSLITSETGNVRILANSYSYFSYVWNENHFIWCFCFEVHEIKLVGDFYG